MSVYVLGYPGDLGGADTELWHVLRLWRQNGLSVKAIPTWGAADDWRRRCTSIGVETVDVPGPDCLADTPGLRGSLVVSFCNGEFLKAAPALRRLSCPLAWANCMTWLFSAERQFCQAHGPFEAHIFQSEYQQTLLAPELVSLGACELHFFRIPGMFDPAEFPFAPLAHPPDTEFVVGRLARPDLDKWSSRTWEIFGAIPFAHLRVRLMGWSERIEEKLGPPPAWADILGPCAEKAGEFLRTLHCLLAINGGARENWPRVGLEAMASGVPIVAQRAWGWREMIEHGRTGYLAKDDHELAYFAAYLAMNEQVRLDVALAARRRLETVLANPQEIWHRWQHLFERLVR